MRSVTRDEGDDNQTHYCADDEGEEEENFVFMFSKIDSCEASLHGAKELAESRRT